MMGRQILGAIPVERRVLLFATVEAGGNPFLEGRTVAETFRPGAWRIIARATGSAPLGRHSAGLVWQLEPDRVLGAGDRVLVATTRRGLAELLGRHPRPPRQDRPDSTRQWTS